MYPMYSFTEEHPCMRTMCGASSICMVLALNLNPGLQPPPQLNPNPPFPHGLRHRASHYPPL